MGRFCHKKLFAGKVVGFRFRSEGVGQACCGVKMSARRISGLSFSKFSMQCFQSRSMGPRVLKICFFIKASSMKLPSVRFEVGPVPSRKVHRWF